MKEIFAKIIKLDNAINYFAIWLWYNFFPIKKLTTLIQVTKCKKKMLNNYVKIVLVIMVFIGVIDFSEAGTCWLRRMENSGKCNKLFTKNVTKDACCHAGSALGFTERDITDAEAFFVDAFSDGVECNSCLDTCEMANCGPNKRCVVKKGRPKCICSPNCKAPKNSKFQNIKVINLSESYNRQNYLDSNRKIDSNHKNNRKNTKLLKENLQISDNSRRSVTKSSLSDKLNAQQNQRNNIKLNKNLIETVTLLNNSENNQDLSQKSDRMVLITNSDPNSLISLNENNKRNRNNVRHKHKKVALSQNKTTTHRLQQHKNDNNHYHHKPRIYNSNNRENFTHEADYLAHVEESFRPENNFYRKKKTQNNFNFANDIMQHGAFYNPVCGTDGKTYKTECQLKKRACRQESSTLMVSYKGHCQTSCKVVQCPDDKHCVEDQNSNPHCVVCAKDCPIDKLPRSTQSTKYVCGVNGVTYKNLCELKRNACMTGRAIPVAYRGPCIEAANCDTIKCKDRQHCLTDLMTGKPRCVTCSYKCPRPKRPQGQPKQLAAHNIKLCGTNNHTYHSWCHMVKDSCNTGYYIDVRHNGNCNHDNKSSPTTINLEP